MALQSIRKRKMTIKDYTPTSREHTGCTHNHTCMYIEPCTNITSSSVRGLPIIMWRIALTYIQT